VGTLINKLKKVNWQRLIYWFVLVTLVIATISVIVMIILAPRRTISGYPDERLKSDYVLMLLQCLIGIFAMFLPALLERKWNLVIPSKMMILYTIFLYCAVYLGEVRDFHYLVPHWDSILHATSGAMLSALGFSIIVLLNRSSKVHVHLSPLFICLFAFCFAVTMGVLWEIYEFLADGLFGMNMQKFALKDGTLLIGRKALEDTMYDLIIDSISAFAVSSMGYVSLIFKKGWIEKLLLRSKGKTKQPEVLFDSPRATDFQD